MTSDDAARLTRYLVQSDQGMGAALEWWITASSEEEILDTFAEVEVIDDEELVSRVSTSEQQPRAVSIGGPYPPGLAELAEKRAAQRQDRNYGLLAHGGRVYLKRADPDEEGVVWFSESGPDGRLLRVVQRLADGTAVGQSSWIMNPPEDLRDPELVPYACTAEEFEAAWRSATVVDD